MKYYIVSSEPLPLADFRKGSNYHVRIVSEEIFDFPFSGKSELYLGKHFYELGSLKKVNVEFYDDVEEEVVQRDVRKVRLK